MLFRDRADAGQRLGAVLRERVKQGIAGDAPLLALALPRGGVPVGFEVALALNAPLDLFIVRKLGAPGHEELAMGAIATGGTRLTNPEVVDSLNIASEQIEAIAAGETRELLRREHLYRGNRPPLDLTAKAVFLVDDGLATGYSMRAAVVAIRRQAPGKIIVAVPVAARSTCAELSREADAVVCLHTPSDFVAVGQWYLDFAQTSDEQVHELLARAAQRSDQHAA